MPALNFKKQFVDKILSGEKKQTIRAMRKYPIKIGNKLYLYTGMRTKQCKKLGESVCNQVDNIYIFTKNLSDSGSTTQFIFEIKINGYFLKKRDKELLAIKDGFNDVYEMMRFFSKRLPFYGQIIYWDKIK